jgi:endoglucanase
MLRREILKGLALSSAALVGSRRTLAQQAASPTQTEAPEILLNQLGFVPAGTKMAALRIQDTGSSDNTFRIFPMHGKAPAFHGVLTPPKLDAASGDTLRAADFTGLHTPGVYRIEAAGFRSDPFPIAPRAYAEALRVAMRGFYGQRCGCSINLGNGYQHPACHLNGAYHPTSGRSGAVPNHGGWHDAGDYGRYIVNSGISTGTLLWAWEFYQDALDTLHLGIPESGGKLPDYLAEVRWNLDWMLSLQDDDGGVWQKQTSEQFCGFVMPQNDTTVSYIIGTGMPPYKSTCATADLASVAAIAARCYNPYDAAYADRCLAAARKAWTWAMAHPDVTFSNPPNINTGDYGDPHCADELLWASAELWRTTGDAPYEAAFLKGFAALPPGAEIQTPSWSNVGPMAYWTYAFAKHDAQPAALNWIHQQTHHAATSLIAQARINGYGNTLSAGEYTWGSNSTAGNQSLLLLVADRMDKNPEAVATAIGNLDYLLGRNCFGVSWVTQLGLRPFQHPHHRPSIADGIAAPWPGLLSGGPNAHPGDPVARTVPSGPPMRMWIDNQMAYSMNEIAINWNAPLVFLLAAANSASI